LADFSIYFAIIVLKNLQNHLPIQNISVTLDRKATILYTREFHAIGEFSGNDLATVPFAMYCFVLLAKNSLSPIKIMIIPEQLSFLPLFFQGNERIIPLPISRNRNTMS